MTRTHAAIELLKHGPLSMREFLEITGWTHSQVHGILTYLIDRQGIVERTKRGVYRLFDRTMEHG